MADVSHGVQAIVQPGLFEACPAEPVVPGPMCEQGEAALAYFESIWPRDVLIGRLALAEALRDVVGTFSPDNKKRGFIESTQGKTEDKISERFFGEKRQDITAVLAAAGRMQEDRSALRSKRLDILSRALGVEALSEQAQGQQAILEHIEAMPRLLMSRLQHKFGRPGIDRPALLNQIDTLIRQMAADEKPGRAA